MGNRRDKKEHVLVLSSGLKADIDGATFINPYNRAFHREMIRVLRNISFLAGFALTRFARKAVKEASTIVITDSDATLSVMRWVKRHSKENAKLVLYYRNKISSVRSRLSPDKVRKAGFEAWSYNMDDCRKLGLTYLHQVINPSPLFTKKEPETRADYDVVFVGRAKGRQADLEAAKQLFDSVGLRSYFFVVDFPDLPDNACVDQNHLGNAEYLSLIQKSNAVLDLVNENNYGLTCRPLEAMNLKRKVITNFADIKEYDFYSKDNFFVLGIDDADSLIDFINSAYNDVPEQILSGYTLSNWVNAFRK